MKARSLVLMTTALAILVGSAHSQPRYRMRALGLPPGANTELKDPTINDSGAVAGYAGTPSGSPRAFVWRNGVWTDLGLLGGATWAAARGIGNSGAVVGDGDAGMWMWARGSMTALPPPPGPGPVVSSGVRKVNTREQAMGVVQWRVGNANISRGVIWQSGVPTDIGVVLGRTSNTLSGINDSGHAVGTASDGSQNVAAFLWRNGMVTDLGRLPGSLFSAPTDLNDSGVAVGYSAFGSSGIVFTWRNGVLSGHPSIDSSKLSYPIAINNEGTIVGHLQPSNLSFLIWRGTMYPLSTLVDSMPARLDVSRLDINNRGEIVLNTRIGSGPDAYLLTPYPAFTRPEAGRFLVGGTVDTITWKAAGLDSVRIMFTDNYRRGGPNAWRTVFRSLPAAAGRVPWVPSDTLASRRCALRIESTADSTFAAESDTFTVKGPLLTRVGGDGNYEKFLPTRHGWSFANIQANFWPSAWWVRFLYTGGVDPATGQPYPRFFSAPPVLGVPSDFTDWPVLVAAFKRDSCFWPRTNTYRQSSVNLWSSSKMAWSGSCFGIAQSGLLYFHYRTQFLAGNPGIPATDTLAAVAGMTDSIRMTINKYFVTQYGRLKQNHDRVNAATTPRQTLQAVRRMWANDSSGDDAGLRFVDPAGSGGHAVIPYRLQRSSTNPAQFRLYVCNSNNPQSLTDYVLIDSLANTWQEFTGLGWGVGNLQMHLYPSAALFLSTQLLPSGPVPRGSVEAGPAEPGRVRFAVPRRSDVRVVSPGGDSIGVRNGRAFNAMAGAMPVTPETGGPQPPLGYDLPGGIYRMRVTNPLDTNVVVYAGTDSVAYAYSRGGAAAGDRDELWYDGGIGVGNPGGSPRTVNLQTVAFEAASDRTADLTGLVIGQDDSAAVRVEGQTRSKLTNFGPAKSYRIRLRSGSASGERLFESGPVTVPAQSAHIVAPRWDSLSTGVLRIFVDLGNNGTIDDTLRIANTLDVGEERGSRDLPGEYNLGQNYPNPFNPSTRVGYDLPRLSRVTVRVYDLLGRTVATLVEGISEPGRYEVQWRGRNDAGVQVPSGVYFLRMDASAVSGDGHYTAVRKMIMLK